MLISGSGGQPRGVRGRVQAEPGMVSGTSGLRCHLAPAGSAMLALLLSGCSSFPSSMNPVSWWHGLQGGAIAKQRPPPPGANQPYPNLATVPPKPAEPDRAALGQSANGLIADRANAQHLPRWHRWPIRPRRAASPALFGRGTVPPPPPAPPPGTRPRAPPCRRRTRRPPRRCRRLARPARPGAGASAARRSPAVQSAALPPRRLCRAARRRCTVPPPPCRPGCDRAAAAPASPPRPPAGARHWWRAGAPPHRRASPAARGAAAAAVPRTPADRRNLPTPAAPPPRRRQLRPAAPRRQHPHVPPTAPAHGQQPKRDIRQRIGGAAATAAAALKAARRTARQRHHRGHRLRRCGLERCPDAQSAGADARLCPAPRRWPPR